MSILICPPSNTGYLHSLLSRPFSEDCSALVHALLADAKALGLGPVDVDNAREMLRYAEKLLCFAPLLAPAQRNQRRIAEKTLRLATLPGAVSGAWAAILLLHHKNRKAAFWGVTLVLTLLQGAVLRLTWPHSPALF